MSNQSGSTSADCSSWREVFEQVPDRDGQCSLWIAEPTEEQGTLEERLRETEQRASDTAQHFQQRI